MPTKSRRAVSSRSGKIDMKTEKKKSPERRGTDTVCAPTIAFVSYAFIIHDFLRAVNVLFATNPPFFRNFYVLTQRTGFFGANFVKLDNSAKNYDKLFFRLYDVI